MATTKMVTVRGFLSHIVIERLFGLTKNYLGIFETRKNPILTGSLCLVRKILFLVLIETHVKLSVVTARKVNPYLISFKKISPFHIPVTD